jgi:hypothetical protein
MDNLNKIISFVLGLIVVVVFIAIVTGRFKLGTGLKNIAKTKITPTVTATVTPTPTTTRKIVVITPSVQKSTNTYKTANGQVKVTQITGNGVSTIPNTGAPTLLLPAAFSMLAAGSFLRKKANKK